MGKDRLVGVVLCGGLSTRYGEDKALAPFEGLPLVDRAIAQLKQVTDRVVLLAGRSPHRFWSRVGHGVEVSSDPGQGPAEALRYWLCDHSVRALVIAVDMPRLTSSDLQVFIEAAPSGAAVLGDSLATLPCLIDAQFLTTSAPALKACLQELKARRIDPAGLQIPNDHLLNINHPSDGAE